MKNRKLFSADKKRQRSIKVNRLSSNFFEIISETVFHFCPDLIGHITLKTVKISIDYRFLDIMYQKHQLFAHILNETELQDRLSYLTFKLPKEFDKKLSLRHIPKIQFIFED